MHAMNSTSQPRATQTPEELRRKGRANLWSAVWEATNKGLSYDEIRATVESTIREIVSDEP